MYIGKGEQVDMPTNLQRNIFRMLEVWWLFHTQEDAEEKSMQIANFKLISGYKSISFTGVY